MRNEPIWLPPEYCVELDKALVELSLERFLLQDMGGLEGACDRAKNLYLYDGVGDLLILAVRLGYGVAACHAFEQGNKRTGFTAMVQFLEMNGKSITPGIEPDDGRFADWFIALVDHRINEAEFTNRTRAYVTDVDTAEAVDALVAMQAGIDLPVTSPHAGNDE